MGETQSAYGNALKLVDAFAAEQISAGKAFANWVEYAQWLAGIKSKEWLYERMGALDDVYEALLLSGFDNFPRPRDCLIMDQIEQAIEVAWYCIDDQDDYRKWRKEKRAAKHG